MLSSIQLFAAKLALFTTVLAYLAIDLFLWQGPVWHVIHDDEQAQQTQVAHVATVFGHGIDEERLQHYAREIAFLSGQDSPDEQQRIRRVMELVRAEIVKVRTVYNENNLPDCLQEAQQELEKFKTHPQWSDILTAMGMSEADLLAFLQARLKEQALLQRALAPLCEVSEEELESQYEQLLPELQIPASRQVNHLFLSFQDKEESEVKAKAEALLSRVQGGESLETLAASEGDAPYALGTIYKNERQTLPELNLFDTSAIPADQVCLARSAWGWHLIEAGPITPARAPSLEECTPSLRSAIQSAKCALALTAYLDASLQELFQTKQIKIYER